MILQILYKHVRNNNINLVRTYFFRFIVFTMYFFLFGVTQIFLNHSYYFFISYFIMILV